LWSVFAQEVGRIFRVTREHIRQIETRAIRNLQTAGRGHKLEEVPETDAAQHEMEES